MHSLPPFRLEAAHGAIVTERDLLGHPAVVYLARHPG
jgi:cytochrome oxidase Cu insertion factor (SCO1/SenC/PrrC family)